MTQEIVINDVKKCRKFGYGISTQPTGHGTDIESPDSPDYTGTLKMINKQMADDRRYLNSIQSSYQSAAWFYDGKPITEIYTVGIVGDDNEYGEGWFRPHNMDEHLSGVYGDALKIRVEVSE